MRRRAKWMCRIWAPFRMHECSQSKHVGMVVFRGLRSFSNATRDGYVVYIPCKCANAGHIYLSTHIPQDPNGPPQPKIPREGKRLSSYLIRERTPHSRVPSMRVSLSPSIRQSSVGLPERTPSRCIGQGARPHEGVCLWNHDDT